MKNNNKNISWLKKRHVDHITHLIHIIQLLFTFANMFTNIELEYNNQYYNKLSSYNIKKEMFFQAGMCCGALTVLQLPF